MHGELVEFEVNLRDGGQEAHVLGEACLVFKSGGVVEFIDVRGHCSPFSHCFVMRKQTFLEGNSKYNCVHVVPVFCQEWVPAKNIAQPILRAC